MDVKLLRHQHHLNQAEFWAAIGITQSGGSRYESERRMPAPVMELVRLHYILGVDTRLITPKNHEVVQALLKGELDAKHINRKVGIAQDLISSLHRVVAKAQELGECA